MARDGHASGNFPGAIPTVPHIVLSLQTISKKQKVLNTIATPINDQWNGSYFWGDRGNCVIFMRETRHKSTGIPISPFWVSIGRWSWFWRPQIRENHPFWDLYDSGPKDPWAKSYFLTSARNEWKTFWKKINFLKENKPLKGNCFSWKKV